MNEPLNVTILSSETNVLWATCKHPFVWQDVFSHARKDLAALVVGDLLGTRKS